MPIQNIYIDTTKDAKDASVLSSNYYQNNQLNGIVFGDTIAYAFTFVNSTIDSGTVSVALGQPNGSVYAYATCSLSASSWIAYLNTATTEGYNALNGEAYIEAYLEVEHTNGVTDERTTYLQQPVILYNAVNSGSFSVVALPQYLSLSESDARYVRQSTAPSASYWTNVGDNLYPYSLTMSVGIGTSTPTEILDVNGNARIRGDLIVDNGYYLTGSMIGNLTGTASRAASSSYALSASRANLSTYANTATYATTAGTGSYAYRSDESTYATAALSASYADSSSYAATATNAVFALTCDTSSYTPTSSFSYRLVGGPVNIKEFGAVGDSTTDDTYAIKQAIAFADANGFDLYFPKGIYRISQSLQTTSSIICDSGDMTVTGPTLYAVFTGSPILTIGTGSTYTWHKTWHVPHIWSATVYATGSIGLNVLNVQRSRIFLNRIQYCDIGMMCEGRGSGNVHNDYFLGDFWTNRIHIFLSASRKTVDGTSGWVNENRFYGGAFSSAGGGPFFLSASCNHLKSVGDITPDGNTNNNNRFIACSFESPNPLVDCELSFSTDFFFDYCRWEKGDGVKYPSLSGSLIRCSGSNNINFNGGYNGDFVAIEHVDRPSNQFKYGSKYGNFHGQKISVGSGYIPALTLQNTWANTNTVFQVIGNTQDPFTNLAKLSYPSWSCNIYTDRIEHKQVIAADYQLKLKDKEGIFFGNGTSSVAITQISASTSPTNRLMVKNDLFVQNDVTASRFSGTSFTGTSFVGNLTGSISGSLTGTSTSASYARTSSFAITSSLSNNTEQVGLVPRWNFLSTGVYFVTGSDQVGYIYLGDVSVSGLYEVTLFGGYSNGNAYGKLTKRYAFQHSLGGTTFEYNSSEVVDAYGPIAINYALGELEMSASVPRIPIYQLQDSSFSNQIAVCIDLYISNATQRSTALAAISIDASGSTVTNSYTRNHLSYYRSNLILQTGSFIATNGGFTGSLTGSVFGRLVGTSSNADTASFLSFAGTNNYVPKWSGNTLTSEGIIYDNGTNVGIGTTAPTVKLYVETNTAGSNGVYVQNNNTASNAFCYVGANALVNASQAGGITIRAHSPSHSVWPLTGLLITETSMTNGLAMFAGGAAPIQLGTNSATKMYISGSTTGEVGIGTTSPGARLHVQGNISASQITANQITASIDASNIIGTVSTASLGSGLSGYIPKFVSNTQLTNSIMNESSNVINIRTAGSTKLIITGSGANFHNGAIVFDGGNDAANYRALGNYYHDTQAADEWFIGRPYSLGSSAITFNYSQSGATHNEAAATYTNALMTLRSTGRVGIGTTNPATTLHVQGNISASQITASSLGINTDTQLSRVTLKTGNNEYGFLHTNNNNVQVGTFVSATAGWIGTKSNHILSFFTNNGSAALTVSSSNVGIGTTSPASTLHVQGNISASQITASTISSNNATIYLGNVLLNTSSVSITNTSSNYTILDISTGSYNSIHVDYNIYGNSGSRAGTMVGIWYGGKIKYSEVTTIDIDTCDIQLSMSLSQSNLQFIATSYTNKGYTVKTLNRFL